MTGHRRRGTLGDHEDPFLILGAACAQMQQVPSVYEKPLSDAVPVHILACTCAALHCV